MDAPHTSEEQRCGACKWILPLEAFSPSYRGKPGTWCRYCFAAYNRGESPSRPHEPRTCDWCGTTYVPKQLKPSAQFCSRQCKTRARNKARQEEVDAAKPERRCAWCGVELPKTMRSDARFCSAVCNSHAHHQTRNYRRRMGKTAPRKPRREPLVNFAEIAERDGWRCGICGGAVSKTRKWPDVLAASLDHILRVSEQGTNEPDNLRLAHYGCNSSRH